MFFDTHIHSEFSFDSKLTITEILEKKSKLNLGITLTEHVDLDLPFIPLIDLEKYLNFYKPYKSNTFLTGLEIGMSLSKKDEIKKFVSKNGKKLDFLIGSIHSLNGQDLYYYMKQDGLCKETTYRAYLENMLACVKEFDFFDTLAHIDYICRYAQFDDANLYYDEYSDLLDNIFKILIAKHKCLELNTKRLNSKEAFDSLLVLFKRYKELDGSYVTIASDAHNKDDIGNNLELAKEFLSIVKLQAVYFQNRIMKVYKI